ISICKTYAWLDITSIPSTDGSSLGNATTGGTTAALPTLGVNDLTQGTLVLIVAPDGLAAGMRQAQSLKTKLPASMTVAIGVPTSQRNLFPKLFEATRSNFDLMKGLQIMALAEGTPGSVLVRVG